MKPLKENTYSQLKPYIKVCKNVLSKNICTQIIKEYLEDDNWFKVPEIPTGPTTRSFQFLRLGDSKVVEQKPDIRKQIDNELYVTYGEIYKQYFKKHNEAKIENDTGYVLMRYKKDDFFSEHVDRFEPGVQRLLACTILLNDDFKGGDFFFFDKSYKVSLKAGDALIYPCNFLFPHQITKITKGTRYSVITWFS